jgi:hypothetical protein
MQEVGFGRGWGGQAGRYYAPVRLLGLAQGAEAYHRYEGDGGDAYAELDHVL